MMKSEYNIEIQEVSSRVVVATDNNFYNVNAAGIALDNFIVVIDTLLYPVQSRQLREYLKDRFNLPIKYVFFTHIDGDHVFGIDTFKEAEIVASNLITPKFKERLEGDWSKEEFDDWKKQKPEHADVIDTIVIRAPDIEFAREYTITDSSKQIELYHSGGHTSCSSWAYFPTEKVVFTGDNLASYDWPYISDQTGNPDGWIKSFEHIMSLDINVVVPGHGKVVDKAHLKEHLEYIKQLREIIVKAVEDDKTADDIELPKFYDPAADWQILRALEHLFKFYSNKA